MNPNDARELLAPAIEARAGTWVDFGAGEGTFTRALAELLGASSHILAVDRDARALAAMRSWTSTVAAKVTPIVGDFSAGFELGDRRPLEGMLFANSLHFVRNASEVLARLVAFLEPGGRVVLIEYDNRRANRWVPFPISVDGLSALTQAAGLSSPKIVARRRSMYQGELYVAVADRLARRAVSER